MLTVMLLPPALLAFRSQAFYHGIQDDDPNVMNFSSGPIFFFDYGEEGVTDALATKLLGNNASLQIAPIELAKRYRGMVILWEHRFYGESMPFGIDNTTGLTLGRYDAYKYLTNEQALEDAVSFATKFQSLAHDSDLSSSSRPWIWIGGSYPGARAALRQRNPDVFFAGWASSAPQKNCSADVHAAVEYADQVLNTGSSVDISLLKEALYLTDQANPVNSGTFPLGGPYSYTSANDSTYSNMTYSELARVLAYPFQNIMGGYRWKNYRAFVELCDSLEKWNPSNFYFIMDSLSLTLINNTEDLAVTAAGVVATYGKRAAFYAYLHAVIEQGISDYKDLIRLPESWFTFYSWRWQTCSEWALFPVLPPGSSLCLSSSFLNASSSEANDCFRLFPYAPSCPNTTAIEKYGGWAMQPSNVMFTNGEHDYWKTLSVHATSDTNPQVLNRPQTTEVPKCNMPPPGNAVFGLVYQNAGHVEDMTRHLLKPRGNSTSFDLGLSLFEKALDAWLPCFQAS